MMFHIADVSPMMVGLIGNSTTAFLSKVCSPNLKGHLLLT